MTLSQIKTIKKYKNKLYTGVKRKKENGYEDIFKKDDNSEYGAVT